MQIRSTNKRLSAFFFFPFLILLFLFASGDKAESSDVRRLHSIYPFLMTPEHISSCPSSPLLPSSFSSSLSNHHTTVVWSSTKPHDTAHQLDQRPESQALRLPSFHHPINSQSHAAFVLLQHHFSAACNRNHGDKDTLVGGVLDEEYRLTVLAGTSSWTSEICHRQLRSKSLEGQVSRGGWHTIIMSPY